MRKYVSLVLFFGLCVLFAACHAEKSKTKKREVRDSLTIRLAVLPVIDCLPYYYAKEEGLFDSLGVKVMLKTYKAAMDADTAFCGVSADMIATDLVKACIWQSRGDSVEVVMTGQLDLYLMTAYSARIRQITSLKEKIIGITRNSSVDMVTDELLSRAKFLSTDLNKPQINNLKLRCYMVDQNQYDGAILPEPYASECEARGARRIFGSQETGLNLSALVVKDSVANRHKEDLVKLKAAYNLAVEQLNGLLEAREAALIDSTSSGKEAAALSLMRYLPDNHSIDIPDSLVKYPAFKPWTEPTDSTLTRVRKWCEERGLVKGEKKNKK